MRRNSLSKEKDILRVLKGRPFFSKYFTIKAKKETTINEYHYTIIVSKKVLKFAVDRNKFKRRIRSVIISQNENINNKIEFVVIAKKGVEKAQFLELKREVLFGLKKLNII